MALTKDQQNKLSQLALNHQQAFLDRISKEQDLDKITLTFDELERLVFSDSYNELVTRITNNTLEEIA
jgi:hypothetical protein